MQTAGRQFGVPILSEEGKALFASAKARAAWQGPLTERGQLLNETGIARYFANEEARQHEQLIRERLRKKVSPVLGGTALGLLETKEAA